MSILRNDRLLKRPVLLGVLLIVLLGPVFPAEGKNEFFPVSVWYAGGKARAPMLEKVTPESPRLWKKDLEQIKSLGFNMVRTWIEWTDCEPEEDRYDFSALRTVVDLAGLADWLKVVRPVEVKVAESDVLVEARWLEGDGGMILFGFNRGERKAAAEFGAAKLAWDRIGRS